MKASSKVGNDDTRPSKTIVTNSPYVSEEAKAYLAGPYGYKEFVQKPTPAVAHA